MLQELINHLNDAMSAIQSLQLQPTEHNCSRVIEALTGIREAAKIGAAMNEKIPVEEPKDEE